MNGTRLKLIFRRLIKLLNANEADVCIRVYVESGGHPESGIPPERFANDAPIIPRPIVTCAAARLDALSERITEEMRIVAGDMKVVMDATQNVSEGTILNFNGADWSVYRIDKPSLFGQVQVVVAYARKMQSGVN